MTDTVINYLNRAKMALDQGLPHVATQMVIDAVKELAAARPHVIDIEGRDAARITPDGNSLNCPYCGGSGHRDDVEPHLLEKVMVDRMPEDPSVVLSEAEMNIIDTLDRRMKDVMVHARLTEAITPPLVVVWEGRMRDKQNMRILWEGSFTVDGNGDVIGEWGSRRD